MLSRRPREYSAEVCIISVLAMAVATLLCFRQGPEFCSRLAMIPERVLKDGEYWRLWTAMAIHADLPHFLFNALYLCFFSYLLYGYFGFWAYPFWSLVLGGVAGYVSLVTYPPGTRLLGASGLVYLMAGFWLTMYVSVERRLTLPRRLLHAIGVALIVFVPTSFQERVSYRSHAIGFAIGVLFALLCFQVRKKRIRSEETLEIEPEADEVIVRPD
jgi:rhomboid protease GluP